MSGIGARGCDDLGRGRASGTAAPRWRALANFPFILAIRLYQVTLAPLMSGHCRFIPTCSNYAIEAYKLHGPVRGSWLTIRRLGRCHPWGGNGFDPVPEPRTADAGASPDSAAESTKPPSDN